MINKVVLWIAFLALIAPITSLSGEERFITSLTPDTEKLFVELFKVYGDEIYIRETSNGIYYLVVKPRVSGRVCSFSETRIFPKKTSAGIRWMFNAAEGDIDMSEYLIYMAPFEEGKCSVNREQYTLANGVTAGVFVAVIDSWNKFVEAGEWKAMLEPGVKTDLEGVRLERVRSCFAGGRMRNKTSVKHIYYSLGNKDEAPEYRMGFIACDMKLVLMFDLIEGKIEARGVSSVY